MRKIVAVLTTLAISLAIAAPAFGQATATDDSSDVAYDNSFNLICPQIVQVFGQQTAYGDANASAADESEAAAAVAQQFDVTITQVNACLGGISTGGPDVPTDESPAPTSAPPSTGVLPETGGASPLAPGIGALLVAGGLLARRLVH